MTILLSGRKWKVLAWNASLVFLAELFIFGYRNVWPLMIFGGVPADARYPGLTWSEGGLLAFVSIVIPLFIPNPYEPIDPDV